MGIFQKLFFGEYDIKTEEKKSGKTITKGKKSKTPLFEMLLSTSPPEIKSSIKAHFSNMGDHEMLALFRGPHFKPAVEKINRYANSKPKQIKVFSAPDVSGGCVYYIRGTFTKEDATFLLHTLKSSMRKGDDVSVTRPD